MSQPTPPLTLADLPSFEGRWADMLDEEYQTPEPEPKTIDPTRSWSSAVQEKTDAPSWRSTGSTPPPDDGSWTVVERRQKKPDATHRHGSRHGRRKHRSRGRSTQTSSARHS
jgi:hypothetical protein